MKVNIDRETLFLVLLAVTMIYIVFFRKNGENYENLEHATFKKQRKTSMNKLTRTQTQTKPQTQQRIQPQQNNTDYMKKLDLLQNELNSNEADFNALEEELKTDFSHLDSRISNLEIQINTPQNNDSINGIKFSKGWTGYPDDKTDGAEISNDTDGFKQLMIVGNKSAGENEGTKRKVGVWDQLTVHGQLCVDDVCIDKNELLNIKNNLLTNNKVALKSSFGKYCSVQPNNTIICDRNAVGPWETVVMEKLK
jgi:hypothetical protein